MALVPPCFIHWPLVLAGPAFPRTGPQEGNDSSVLPSCQAVPNKWGSLLWYKKVMPFSGQHSTVLVSMLGAGGALTTALGGVIGLSLATDLYNVALIKLSHAGGVLVCDKDTESEDMLACLSQAASEDTQKSLVAKLASYWFPK